MNHRPLRPVEGYPEADVLPAAPPVDPAGEGLAAASVPTRPEIAALRFLDPGSVSTTIPLRFPFEFEDREWREVTVRRLSVAEVGAVVESTGGTLDLYAFLAAMTGLPAPVLRGMMGDDGEEVLRTGRPLLPRFVETMLFPTAETETETAKGSSAGAAMPSPLPGP